MIFVSVCNADSTSIRDGADAFQKGEFKQAANAFQKAAENSPNNSRIVHNHGVALAASGELDNAIEILHKSALDHDPKIAASSLNSLAQIHIDKAKNLLSENPAETPEDKRNEILKLIEKSEKYYADSLAIEPENKNIKQNIEQLKTWKTKIESQWNQFDRIQKRQSDLYNRLNWIDNGQREIANSIANSKELSNSPKKYQSLYESAEKQQQIVDEINAVGNDLKNQLAQNNQQNSPENAAFLQAINNAREIAADAKKSLDNFDENNSQKQAELSSNQLRQLKLPFAPFEKVVEETEKIQTQLVDNNPSSNKDNNDNNSQNQNPNNRNDNSKTLNLQQQIAEQQLVSNLTQLMLYRAKEELAKLQSQQSQQSQSLTQNNNEPTQPTTPAQTNPQQKSIELAIKYEPEIRKLAEESVSLLNQNKFDNALPKQKQAQKLLREILNQQNQNQNQNQDQKNQDQDQNQDQQNQNDQKNNEQNNDQKNNQSQSQEEKNEQKENNSTNEEKSRQEEKAERLIRQVKRKQQEANERREELRDVLLYPTPVDKDW
ncbi:MAG: hypothetical protein LBB88_10665 [Planctomycetaceae bacterium]|nr:hypothetical protein [Planctomycetaceae bacterium]